MIEKCEAALGACALAPKPVKKWEMEHDSDNANDAMLLLGIAEYGSALAGGGPATRPFKLATWVTQAAISRPGRRALTEKEIEGIKRDTIGADQLKWPRTRKT